MSKCQGQFEPVPRKQRDRTHTCDRERGHNGPHHCPTCGCRWIGVRGIRPNYLVDERGIRVGP